MNKLFLKHLELKGYKQADFEGMEAEKQAEMERDYLSHLEEKIENLATNESVKEQIKGLATSEQIKTLEEMINEMKDANVTQENKLVSLKEELAAQLKSKENEIKNTVKGGFVEIELKAVANITTASGVNTSPPSITGVQQAPLNNVGLRRMAIGELVTSFNTNQSAYAYTEAEPKEGGFDFVAEGGTKPQIDLKWNTRYSQPVKVAAWMKLTEESVQDVANLESVAYDFLAKQHALKYAKALLFGDGISPNPKGATVYARLFSAGPLALAVSKPNFLDVINAVVTDIATTHNYTDEMPYMANVVLVNPNDFFINLVSAKTTDGVPLYPTASLFNTVTIGGITIMPEESIPTGKIFVADMTKYNTTNYMPYTVKIGWVNDDFIKNQFVILAESRFHAFVKKLDEQAFVYDDIATIRTAITKP